jgi:ferredoxin
VGSVPLAIEVSVDPDLCIGSGDCVRIAPDGFLIDDDLGVSQPLPGAAGLPETVLLEAARTCPTQSIRLVVDGRVVHASNSGR